MIIKISRAAVAAAMLFIACNSAYAQISINVGGPRVFTGWHGDRYYDGHRYWGRDEWNRRHRPHGGWHRGPPRGGFGHGGPGRGRDDHRGGHR